jgi:hypothetical protein
MRGCHAANQFTLFSKSSAPHGAPDSHSPSLSRQHAARAAPPFGGGDRIRTDDRLVANQVLYQLSYAPGVGGLGWTRTTDLPLIRRTL